MENLSEVDNFFLFYSLLAIVDFFEWIIHESMKKQPVKLIGMLIEVNFGLSCLVGYMRNRLIAVIKYLLYW